MTNTIEAVNDWRDQAAGVSQLNQVPLTGDIDASTDLSGVVVVEGYMVLGADEGHQIQVLARCDDGKSWCLQSRTPLAKRDQETDIEAITYGDGYLYVIGSHSARRRLMREDLSARRNRERLHNIRYDESRNRLYRLPFDSSTGKLGKAKSINLAKRLSKEPLLQIFHGIPSKENGIDIEGLAYRDGKLTIGFRGPVLRDNYVPVMRLAFESPKHYHLRFVRLKGQGIRDLIALDNGFVLLTGPVNDAPGPFRLWWWDGEDQIPGKDKTPGEAIELGEVSTAGGAKAEGLALLSCKPGIAEVIVVYETLTAPQAVSMRLALPG